MRVTSSSCPPTARRTRPSMPARNAARVLPDPVGAMMSVWRPEPLAKPRSNGRMEALEHDLLIPLLRRCSRGVRGSPCARRWGAYEQVVAARRFARARAAQAMVLIIADDAV